MTDRTLCWQPRVHRWDVQEISFAGPEAGNPCGQCITAVFTGAREQRTVQGFYDGDGRYMVRFMPAHEGEYRFRIPLPEGELGGSFTVLPAREGVHGPVQVYRHLLLRITI